MRASLQQHPDTPDDAVSGIEVEATRPGPQSLKLRFVVGGDIDRILWPQSLRPSEAKALWRYTCFEAFIRSGDGEGYFEFNLSPARRFAAYAFDGYRSGMTPQAGVELRDLFQDRDDGRYVYEAVLDLGRLGLPVDRPWRVGLSTVIQAASGAFSYWALAHAPGKPDFHHPDAFALELPRDDQ